MTKRIQAVKVTLLTLMGVAAVILAAAVPLGNDRQLMRALQELLRFQAGFNQKALEKFLYDSAAARGGVSIQAVAEFLGGPNSPPLKAKRPPPAIAPWIRVDLSTLRAANAFSKPNASVQIGTVRPQELAASIEWRLVRRKESQEKYELTDIELSKDLAGERAIESEHRAVRARQEALKAKIASEAATKKAEKLSDLYDLQRKWHSSWKVLQKSLENRDKARAEAEEKGKIFEQAKADYFTLAEQAEKASAETAGPKTAIAGNKTSISVFAVASLKAKTSGAQFQLRFPASLDLNPSAVPSLTGCDFTATRAANLWDAVADKPVASAIRYLEKQFSWHYRYFRLFGVKIGGMTFLQFTPLALIVILLLLISQIGKAASGYNPFDTQKDWTSLPKVGLKPAWLNAVSTIVLPTAACLLCIWSLMRIDELPVAPILCLLGSLGLGSYGYIRVNALRRLREEVTRSHAAPKVAS